MVPSKRTSLLLLLGVLALGGGGLSLVWRVVWQLLSPLASMGLRELGYGVWFWPPLLAACLTRQPGAPMLVGLLSGLMEWGVLGSAPWSARLLAAVVVEALMWRRQPTLAQVGLVGLVAAGATLMLDPPLGVAPLGWTDLTAGIARVIGGGVIGGGGVWLLYPGRRPH